MFFTPELMALFRPPINASWNCLPPLGLCWHCLPMTLFARFIFKVSPALRSRLFHFLLAWGHLPVFWPAISFQRWIMFFLGIVVSYSTGSECCLEFVLFSQPMVRVTIIHDWVTTFIVVHDRYTTNGYALLVPHVVNHKMDLQWKPQSNLYKKFSHLYYMK